LAILAYCQSFYNLPWFYSFNKAISIGLLFTEIDACFSTIFLKIKEKEKAYSRYQRGFSKIQKFSQKRLPVFWERFL
jgi:hypothetical protein